MILKNICISSLFILFFTYHQEKFSKRCMGNYNPTIAQSYASSCETRQISRGVHKLMCGAFYTSSKRKKLSEWIIILVSTQASSAPLTLLPVSMSSSLCQTKWISLTAQKEFAYIFWLESTKTKGKGYLLNYSCCGEKNIDIPLILISPFPSAPNGIKSTCHPVTCRQIIRAHHWKKLLFLLQFRLAYLRYCLIVIYFIHQLHR